MSIRLIVEVLDHWKDFGLTVGERDDLIVIAENANDATRETYGSIHQDYVLRRANKTAKSWRTAIGRLMQKAALEYAIHNGREMRGHPGQHAVYRLTVLCPDPPHWGQRGLCTDLEEMGPPPEDAFPEMGPLPEDPTAEMGPLAEDKGSSTRGPDSGNGSSGGGEWVRQQRTPTPVTPVTSKNTSANEAFDAFWDAYPRKIAKGAARTAFTKALKRGATAGHLAEAAASHATAWKAKGTEAQFIPYPATWLNQERYDDAPEPVSTPRGPQPPAYQPPVF